jgi:hypothetical protein
LRIVLEEESTDEKPSKLCSDEYGLSMWELSVFVEGILVIKFTAEFPEGGLLNSCEVSR